MRVISPSIETSVFFESSIVQTTVSKGKVPHEVGRLFRLPPELELTNNSLQKHIAANQSSCSKLKILGFASCFDPGVLVFIFYLFLKEAHQSNTSSTQSFRNQMVLPKGLMDIVDHALLWNQKGRKHPAAIAGNKKKCTVCAMSLLLYLRLVLHVQKNHQENE